QADAQGSGAAHQRCAAAVAEQRTRRAPLGEASAAKRSGAAHRLSCEAKRSCASTQLRSEAELRIDSAAKRSGAAHRLSCEAKRSAASTQLRSEAELRIDSAAKRSGAAHRLSCEAKRERAPISGPGVMRVLVGVGWSRPGRTRRE